MACLISKSSAQSLKRKKINLADSVIAALHADVSDNRNVTAPGKWHDLFGARAAWNLVIGVTSWLQALCNISLYKKLGTETSLANFVDSGM